MLVGVKVFVVGCKERPWSWGRGRVESGFDGREIFSIEKMLMK
jgi:hypothetical protein